MHSQLAEGKPEASRTAQLGETGTADDPSALHGLLKAVPGEGSTKNPSKKDEAAVSAADAVDLGTAGCEAEICKITRQSGIAVVVSKRRPHHGGGKLNY